MRNICGLNREVIPRHLSTRDVMTPSSRRKERRQLNNKKLGNDFEAELCEMLSFHGFWCHNLAVKKEGQPADVFAARNGKAYLIDCKVCSTKKGFALSRKEENQELAMTLWKECGNGEGWFAILLAGIVYMIPHFTINALSNHQTYISPKDIFECGTPLDKWVKKCK